MNNLLDELLSLHSQGTLHDADHGQICVGCGGQWPCRTRQIIERHALDALRTTPPEES